MDWFLYDNSLRHERKRITVKYFLTLLYNVIKTEANVGRCFTKICSDNFVKFTGEHLKLGLFSQGAGFPAGIYLFKVNNGNTRTGVSIVNFEQVNTGWLEPEIFFETTKISSSHKKFSFVHTS